MYHFYLVFVEAIFFYELVDGVLDTLLALDNLFDEHLGSILGVVALGDDSVVLGGVDTGDTSGDQFSFFVGEVHFFFLMLFNFYL